MAFTSVDLASVEAAIKALATGDRVAQVRLDGKMVTYQETDMARLVELRGIIQREIAIAVGGKRSRFTTTNKGY